MKRVGLFLLVLASGCAAEGARTLLILHNQIPDEGCGIPATDTGVYSVQGTIDLATSTQFSFFPLVRNTADEGENPNTRTVILEGADVELTAGPSDASQALVDALGDDAQRTTLISGSIDPGGGVTSTYYPLLDAQQISLMGAPGQPTQINARTRVFGSVGGNSIESPWFNFPITVCASGCVLWTYDNDGDPATPPVTQDAPPPTACFGDQTPNALVGMM